MLKCDSISGNHYQCRPLFVDDKSLLFVAAGSAIHVASLITGELICALKAYAGNITSIVLHPRQLDTVRNTCSWLCQTLYVLRVDRCT